MARGIAAIAPMVFAAGSKLNELVVSTTVPPWKSDAASHVDDAIYRARGRIHDPNRRVHSLEPLGAYGRGWIKLPDLVGRGYVDVEPAQDV